VYSHIYETLFELTADGEIVPLLATDYTTSADGLTWTITHPQGVTFHDGTPLTANEVKASIEQFLDPATAAPVPLPAEPHRARSTSSTRTARVQAHVAPSRRCSRT
jgi:ABC-type transport system substrate-binding protein